MSYQNILAERVESVAIITLNRPEKLNALSYELAMELDEELAKIESDDDARVVILTGAGPRAFSSGGDIHQMVKSTPEEMAARTDARREANWHLGDFHQADHRRHQRPGLRRRRATDDDVGHSHRLRTRRDPIPRRKIWPRQFHLVFALGRGHAQSKRIALHGTAD